MARDNASDSDNANASANANANAHASGNDRHDPTSGANFDELRGHVPAPRRAPPIAAQRPSAPWSRLSVLDWLLAVGHVVTRKLRGVPRAPMVRLHPKP